MNNSYRLEQVAIRMVKMPPLISNEPIINPDAAIRVMNDTLKEFDREALVVVNLQNDLKPINMNFVSLGTLNSSVAHPREILKTSILSNASCIMLFHNHPSGNLSPSREDVELTDRMQKACQLMEIPILDHIIIGTNDRYYSFREKGILNIEEPAMAQDIDEFRWESIVAEQKAYFDPKKNAEDRKQEMKDITERLERGVSEIFQSEKYQLFLNTMAKFPKYSLNNNMLIMMQKPDATLCQSYTGWKQMGRFVKKGEKGIRILAPAPFKREREQNKVDEKGKTVLDKDGKPVKETVQIDITAFKPVSTFDLSQTEGAPLPTIGVSELTGSVEGYATLFQAIKEASPVPIGFEDIEGGAKGYFHTRENRIAIQEGMSEIQNVKTAIHEMAHAKLHNMAVQKSREDGGQTRSSKEVEAESVAYTVCQHYGIDTSDYSFAYVAGWSEGKELSELKESLNTIRTAASELITAIDEKAQALINEKEEPRETREEKLDQLAEKLDQFAYDLDPYGYQDEAGSREEGLAQIQGMLKSEEIDSLQDELKKNLEDVKGSNPELEAQGEKLLQEIEKLKQEKLNGTEEKEAKKPSIRKRLKEEKATETQRKVRASKTKHKEEVR